jgi:predicted deacetylase
MFEGLDLNQVYSLIASYLMSLAFILFVLYLIFRFKLDLLFLKNLSRFFDRHRIAIRHSLIIVLIMSIVGFGIINYMNYELDQSTRVRVPEKLVIIEIDDYWNIRDTEPYYGDYGYTMENYYDVSNILDKYGYVATLGVAPYIFVDSIRKNFDLDEDGRMVNYLIELESKGYELAMHGYNHCLNPNYCPRYEEVYFNVNQGKEELEEIFGINFFTYLPPGNKWTTEQYNNVKSVDFKFIANTHVPIAYFDEDIIITPKGYDPVYHYDWHRKDFRHTSYEEWVSAYEKTEFFVLQLHCNTFDSQEKLDDLDMFLAYLYEDGAKVVTYKGAYELIFEEKKGVLKSLKRNFGL